MSTRMLKSRELILHMLTELEQPVKPLTKWEQSFVESISDQFGERGTLSDRQFEKLEDIYAEKTA